MFGFFEILVLAVIAFLVLGPEEFPKATQKFLRFINSFKGTFTNLKMEVNDIKKEAEDNFLKIKKEIDKSVQEPINNITQEVEKNFFETKKAISSKNEDEDKNNE